MSADRFTQEQILCGLRIFCEEEFGLGALGFGTSFDPDMRLDQLLRDAAGGWEDLGIDDLILGLEWFFGFSCSPEEWERFLDQSSEKEKKWDNDISPSLTFRRLADFIRERLEPISLEPLALLGKPCRTAGIFRGLEQLTVQINPDVERFAPSTPIRERLKGSRLHCFWNRLRWIAEAQIPPPPRITLRSWRFMQSLCFKFAVGILIALWKRDLTGLAAGTFVTILLLIPVGIIVVFINAQMNPLPKEIQTFGDLARYLAFITEDQQPQGASCSTP